MHGLFRTQKRRSAATDSRLYYDRVPFVINSSHAQDSRRDALTGRPLRYRIQAIKNERRPQAAKKIHGQRPANGALRGRSQAPNSMNELRPTMNGFTLGRRPQNKKIQIFLFF